MIKWLLRTSFFKQGLASPSLYQIISWWEIRRIAYNIILLIVGVLAILIMAGIEAITGETYVNFPDPPILAIMFFAFMANVCYTGGEIAEVIARRFFDDEADHFGEIAFSLGLLLSVSITILPAILFIVQIILGYLDIIFTRI